MEWAEVDEGFYGIESSASLIGLDRRGESQGCFSGTGRGGGGGGEEPYCREQELGSVRRS